MLRFCYVDAILQLMLRSALAVQRLNLSLDCRSEYHLPPLIQLNLCRVGVRT